LTIETLDAYSSLIATPVNLLPRLLNDRVMPLEIVHMLRIETNPVYRRTIALILLAFPITLVRAQTVVGIRGTQFTINGQTTYSAASGFPAASPSLEGTLLNVRAVQAIFDDAHYPTQGSKEHPYLSSVASPVSFDYPNGPYGAAQNLDEFLAALPTWRRAGVQAFTVNLQGGGPSDGNFGVHDQPHLNSGFDPHGNLKSAYAQRLTRVIERADQLGMVVIVGYFYQGSEHWIDEAPDDKYMREAVRQASLFLKGLPHRNMMIEIANEVSPTMYRHPLLQSNGILDAVNLAKESVQHQIPVSFSWIGVPPPRGSRANDALRAVDYVLTHTNHRSAEGVHQYIQAMRAAVGYDRPVLINEDGISSFNLQAAIEEHAGWGYYDQGLNNYQDGFQSPPVNWKISSTAKWIFFDQVARLSGSPSPRVPDEVDPVLPVIKLIGLNAGQSLTSKTRVEAVIADRDPRWPIRRVEFFIDDRPYSYTVTAPFLLGSNQGAGGLDDLASGSHKLRIVAYDERGPAFAETCSQLEVPFVIEK